MKAIILAILASLPLLAVAAPQPKEYRDPAQVRAFKKVTPCPATGKIQKTCKGYVVDHIKALACGGADRPINMQWQTVADAKAKDKWELKECGK